MVILAVTCTFTTAYSTQWQIIPLLSKAINHFKSHRSERMIALLKVLLAEEYYHVRQYDNALTWGSHDTHTHIHTHTHTTLCTNSLTFINNILIPQKCSLLEGVVVLYRQEQWWSALCSVLQTMLRSDESHFTAYRSSALVTCIAY